MERAGTSYTVQLNLGTVGQTDARGRRPVLVLVKCRYFSTRINTGVRLLPSQWDAARHRPTEEGTPEARQMAAVLARCEATVAVCEANGWYTRMAFEKAYGPMATVRPVRRPTRRDSVGAIDFFEQELVAGHLTQGGEYAERMHDAINVLKAFQPELRFEDINEEWVRRLDEYLAKYKRLATSTRYRYHQRYRKMIRRAIAREFMSAGEDPYLLVRFPKGKANRAALRREEVERLASLVFEEEQGKDYVAVRDMFLFSCYCGLRFGDVQRVQYDMLDKDWVLRITMAKVDREVILPLGTLFNGKALDYLMPYMLGEGHGCIFPQYTNQYVNRVLKELATRAHIKTHVTFHVARHTFGSMLAEVIDDPFTIRELMGHTAIQTSMQYIHTSSNHLVRKLANVKWD